MKAFWLLAVVPVAAQIQVSASLWPQRETRQLFGRRWEFSLWSVAMVNEGPVKTTVWESSVCAALIESGIQCVVSEHIASVVPDLERRSPWEVSARLASNAALGGLLLGINENIAMPVGAKAGLAMFLAFGPQLAGILRGEKPDLRGNFTKLAWKTEQGKILEPGGSASAVMFSTRYSGQGGRHVTIP